MGTVVDLGNLGSRGVTVPGEGTYDQAGQSVSGAGDFNGDGFDDYIIAATTADGYSGVSYVVYGGAQRNASVDLSKLTSNVGFAIKGTGYAILHVASAGDVNGDGFDDLLIGSAGGGFYYGGATKAYLVFGRPGGVGTINVGQLAPSDGFVVSGAYGYGGNRLSVSSAGDINGDGFDDIVVGMTNITPGGSAFVIYGKAGGFANIDVTDPAATTATIRGALNGDALGGSVSSAGDINGDGFDDLIIGAPYADNGGNGAGQAYVIFGKAAALGTIDVGNMAAGTGFTIQGDTAGDDAGYQVKSAGDINGDGYDDIIIGAPFGDDGGDGAGEAYVLFGHAGTFANIDLTNIPAGAGFTIIGDRTGDAAGFSVAGAGDVNGDGYDDVVVGAPFADDNGNFSGSTFLIYGHGGAFANLDLSNLPTSAGAVLRGGATGDDAGMSVSGAGDVDRDGFDDIIIGSPYSDQRAASSGAAYVIYGRNSLAPDAANDFNGDGRSDLLLRSDSGAIATWLASSTAFVPGWGTLVSTDWKVAETGDFNGDGRDDILWRNNNGSVSTWLGGTNGGFSVGWGTSLALDQKVAGAGDFNGDGFDDVLLRTDAGGISMWLGGSGGGFVGGPSTTIAASWKIGGTGDVNGDGRDDIIWRNDSGAVATWLGAANGTFAPGWGTAVGIDWKIAATGDFNGDGRTDILWRSDAGQVSDWAGQSNGGFTPTWGTAAPTGWSVASVGDLNGDGFDDIVWQQDSTGQLSAWVGAFSGGFSTANAAGYSNPLASNWHVQDPFF